MTEPIRDTIEREIARLSEQSRKDENRLVIGCILDVTVPPAVAVAFVYAIVWIFRHA